MVCLKTVFGNIQYCVFFIQCMRILVCIMRFENIPYCVLFIQCMRILVCIMRFDNVLYCVIFIQYAYLGVHYEV